MGAPKRYFDESNSDAAGPSPKRFQKGGNGGGSKDGGRPQKEKFKPKEGFIAAGLRSYTEAAEEAKKADEEAKKAELSEGWKDKTTTQTTLHLTHLPPTLTSPQLSILCSSYAPLRSAFVVSTSSASSKPAAGGVASSSANAISTGPGRDRTGKSTSRGFGYVRFVLRTDAEKCLKDWGNSEVGIPRSQVKELEGMEGMENVEWDKVCGRGGIKMGWAKKKLKEGEEPETGPAKEKKEKKGPKMNKERKEWIDYGAEGAPERPQGGFDHSASRTVIVQGLPTEEELLAAAKAKKEKKDAAAEEDDDDEEGEDDDEEEKDGEEEKEGEGEASASSSKAVDWKKAIRQKAKKSGDIEDVQWPVVLSSGETVATIRMVSPRQAHEVSKKLHNHVFRGVVVSACVKSSWDLVQKLGRAKAGGRIVVRNLGFDITIADLRTVFSKFGPLHSITLPLNAETSQPRGFSFIYYLNKSNATTAISKVNGTRIYAGMANERIASEGGKEGKKKEVRLKRKQEKDEVGGGGGEKGRVVAVDWALSKDEYKKMVVDGEKDSGSESEEDSDEDEEESEEESENEEDEDSDMSPVPVGASDEEDHHPDDDDDELDEEPKGPEPPKGTTLFVRNIVFEATEAEVYDLFKSFGPVRYARIVYDPTTKRSRGTAFVCFWNDEDAQKVLYASETLNAGLFGETSNKKEKNQQSMLMADPNASGASALTLHGRVLAAVAAVSKDDADKLREDRDKKGAAKTDRRNLYLMREGVIFPSWAIAQTLHPTDMTARQASFDARKGLLRSNPSLYISRTRLSIRQIPLYVSDGMLKRLANYAIKEFDKEVKAGHQKALTTDELNNVVIDASGVLPPEKTERIRGVPPSRVRQAKILRQTDRVDPLTGLGRSKGYGFLELGSHADALRVLRWANANRDVGALFRGWWRETLEKLIEKEKAGGEKTSGKGITVKDKEERIKRLKEKMSELVEEEELAKGKAAKREAKGKPTGEGGRSSKCLIIEFSIENQVTTKRRAEKAQRARERAKRTKDRNEDSDDEEGSDNEDEEEDEAPKAAKSKSNKRKSSDDSEAIKKKVKVAIEKKKEIAAEDDAQEKGQPSKLWTGSIIGKKRRQKAGRK